MKTKRLVPVDEPRNEDGSFRNQSLSYWAKRLRIPFNTFYTKSTELGLGEIANEDDLRRAVQIIQKKATPFSALAELFGDDVTLRDLSQYECLP